MAILPKHALYSLTLHKIVGAAVQPPCHSVTPSLHTLVGAQFPWILSKKDLGLWALPAAVPSTPRHSALLTSSFTKQLGLYPAAVHCVCVYVAIEIFLRSLQSHLDAVCSRHTSVILDSILGEYLLKYSKDLFTRHGLCQSEIPLLGLVLFSPLGQRLCLLVGWSAPQWVEPGCTLHGYSADVLPPVAQII